MSSSIALLLVFQCFWLKKVYEEQRTWLQKESDNIFRNTIMQLQDSLLQSKIDHSPYQNKGTNILRRSSEKLPKSEADTLIFINQEGYRIPFSTVNISKPNFNFNKIRNDSFHSFRRSPGENFRIRIASALTLSPDSVQSIQINKELLRVVLSNKDINGKHDILIKLDNDSLPTATIKKAFAKQLQFAGLPHTFKIQKHNLPDVDLPEKELFVGPIPTGMPPRDLCTAIILDYNNYLIQKTLPQFLFSFFLISITSFSFWLIYRSLRQQQRLAVLKNDFISNITHELKTPIATVSVAIEALNNFNALQNPQLTKEYLDISKNELNRLTILVDKVLKMAIFEQTPPELRFEVFNFSDMVRQIINSMKLQFEKYNAKVNFITSDEAITVDGDRIHLTSVIYNLLDNALKYSKENPQINVYIEGQNGQLQLAVQDNGIGIPAEYKNRIFEKFFRVPTGDVHNVKGYGLGLNYVSSVVKQHGGSIGVESEAGEGSTFTVHLPKGKE